MRSPGPKSAYTTGKEAQPVKSVLYPDRKPTFKRDVPTRRLTDDEYKIRREKGLCFKCDEKLTVRHRCSRKELCVLMVCKEREIEIEYEEGDKETEADVHALVMEHFLEHSLRSIIRVLTPGAMKIKGQISDREIMILIDCGATHNFISEGMLAELKILIV